MRTDDEQTELLKLPDAARRANVSVATMRRRVLAGDVPAVRLGPSDRHPIRVPADALEAWLFNDEGDAA